MSSFTWYAEPAEVPIGKAEIPVSILVGVAEVEDHGDALTMVVHSEHLNVVLPLTAGQARDLGRLLTDIAAELRRIGEGSPHVPRNSAGGTSCPPH